MSKNIEMQELTSNGYETLFPKTNVSQIDKFEDNVWQVGDIRTTTRTDLGDKWLLCNGEVLDARSYPQLAQQTLDFMGMKEGSGRFEDIAVNGDTIVAVTGNSIIYTSLDAGTTWRTITTYYTDEAATSSSSLSDYITSCVNHEDTWICLGSSNQSEANCYLYITNDIQSGKWVRYLCTYRFYAPSYIRFYENKWCVFAKKTFTTIDLFYSETPTNPQSWKSVVIYNGSRTLNCPPLYQGGYYTFNTNPMLASKTLDGKYETIANYANMQYLKYVNGIWFLWLQATATSFISVYCKKGDLDGTYTFKRFVNPFGATYSVSVSNVYYSGGFYHLVISAHKKYGVLKFKDIGEDTTVESIFIPLGDIYSDSGSNLAWYEDSDGYIYSIFYTKESSSSQYYYGLASNRFIPLLEAQNSTYTYIKAKEDI